MKKRKLKRRIKELECGNLALADINHSLCCELKKLKVDSTAKVWDMMGDMSVLAHENRRLKKELKR